METQTSWNSYRDKITEEAGVLYWELLDSKRGCLKQLLLPHSLCVEVLEHMHNSHQRVERTFQLVRARCCWLGMYSAIEEYCQRCKHCIVVWGSSKNSR